MLSFLSPFYQADCKSSLTWSFSVYIINDCIKDSVGVFRYMVDAADREKVEASRNELHNLLDKPQLQGIPVRRIYYCCWSFPLVLLIEDCIFVLFYYWWIFQNNRESSLAIDRTTPFPDPSPLLCCNYRAWLSISTVSSCGPRCPHWGHYRLSSAEEANRSMIICL